MSQGLDYSAGPPNPDSLTGYNPICRYVCRSTRLPAKRLTPGERDRLRAAGKIIVLVFEDGEGNALQGHTQGVNDGLEAAKQAQGLGYPAGCVVYAAVDCDVPAARMDTVMAYLDGFAQGLGTHYRAGVYGSYAVVKAALDGGHAAKAWQTRAWSGTPARIDRRASLYQNARTVSIDGVTCDLNDVLRDDHGGWPAPNTPTAGGNMLDLKQQLFEAVSWRKGKVLLDDWLSVVGAGCSAMQRVPGLLGDLKTSIDQLAATIREKQ